MSPARTAALGTMSLAVALLPGAARADDLPSPRLVPELDAPFRQKDQAQDPPRYADPWSSRPRSVSVQGGSGGGPLGYGGLSFEFAPSKYFVTGAGAGIGQSGVTGALWPRLRFPVTRWLAPGIGIPFSAGPYEYVAQAQDQCALAGCGTGFRTARSWSLAFWGHIEPNVEIRFPSGVTMRLFAGYSSILNGKDDRCTSTLPGGCPSSLGENKWYGGFALGYAF
jgi:hypothetical protein